MMAMLSAVSCVNGNSDNNAATTDTIDSTAIAPNDSDSVISVTGIALDGAMNSIFIKTANGDTINFAYPDLDESKQDSWEVGDTMTVKYMKEVNANDSVIQLINNSKSAK